VALFFGLFIFGTLSAQFCWHGATAVSFDSLSSLASGTVKLHGSIHLGIGFHSPFGEMGIGLLREIFLCITGWRETPWLILDLIHAHLLVVLVFLIFLVPRG
jgi:hypothetical protein